MVVSILVGIVLGFLAGLGVGGGSLLILWLTFVVRMPYDAARGTNLLFFLPAAVIACLFRWRQGNVDFLKVWPAILCGCAAAGFCAWIAPSLDMELLKKFFGGLLIVTGLREVFHNTKG